MATVKNVNVQGKVVIFPLYTFTLQKRGYKISHKSDKASNMKLGEYLFKASAERALKKSEPKLPDIVFYFDGKWVEYFSDEEEIPVKLRNDKCEFIYFPALVPNEMDYNVEYNLNAIKYFLEMYSSAKISIK